MPPTSQNTRILPYNELLHAWPLGRLVSLATAKNLPDPDPLSKEGYAGMIIAATATDHANENVIETNGIFAFHVGDIPNINALPRDFELEQEEHDEARDAPRVEDESEVEEEVGATSTKRKFDEITKDDDHSESRTPEPLAGESSNEKRMRLDFIDYLENNVGFSVESMKARLVNMSRKCAGHRERFNFYDNALRATTDFSHMTPDAMRRSMIEWVGGRPPLAKKTMEFFARHYKHDKKMHPKANLVTASKPSSSSNNRSRAARGTKKVASTCHHCGKPNHYQKDCRTKCGNISWDRCANK